MDYYYCTLLGMQLTLAIHFFLLQRLEGTVFGSVT
uniref:Uncharacterized protein n=1 Tax=Rhizophora mucronata TaxID=61149 RepID=A0A2P2MVG6_RHIMU